MTESCLTMWLFVIKPGWRIYPCVQNGLKRAECRRNNYDRLVEKNWSRIRNNRSLTLILKGLSKPPFLTSIDSKLIHRTVFVLKGQSRFKAFRFHSGRIFSSSPYFFFPFFQYLLPLSISSASFCPVHN